MDTPLNQAEWDFFMVALKEEARSLLWEVGSSAEPHALVQSVLGDLEALAPREDGSEDRSREEIWRQVRERLLKAAYASRPYCIRCGTCCTKGSPTLAHGDLPLFRNNVFKPSDLMTIRKGEQTLDTVTEEIRPAPCEMIKIREVPGARECSFYRNLDKTCGIYEVRPHQCRLQECWSQDRATPDWGEPLTREGLLAQTGDLWRIINRHEERCSHEELGRAMVRLSATHGETVEEVLEILRYDQYVRDFVCEHFQLPADALEFLFGRPLTASLGAYGLKLDQKSDGSYLLSTITVGKERED